MLAIMGHLLLLGCLVVTETKGEVKFCQYNIHTDNNKPVEQLYS